MEHPYLEFNTLNPNPIIANTTLMISSIIPEPYSLVSSIISKKSTLPNLTYVPEMDTAE